MGNNCCSQQRQFHNQFNDEQLNIKVKQIPLKKKGSLNLMNLPNTQVVSQIINLPNISNNIKRTKKKLKLNQNQQQYGSFYKLKNKLICQGNVKDDKFTGKFRIFSNQGDILQTQIVQQKLSNNIRLFCNNGNYFIGKIKSDDLIITKQIDQTYQIIKNIKLSSMQGIVQQHGINYKGQLLNGKPHGKGRQKTNSYRFYGQYQYGYKIKGVLQWNIDQIQHIHKYQGNFVNNLLQGKGKLQTNQYIYIGDFLKGSKSGYGKQINKSNNQIYEGQFLNNHRHGKGKITDSNGNIRHNNWQNGNEIKRDKIKKKYTKIEAQRKSTIIQKKNTIRSQNQEQIRAKQLQNQMRDQMRANLAMKSRKLQKSSF